MIFDEKMERQYRTYAPFLSIYNFGSLSIVGVKPEME